MRHVRFAATSLSFSCWAFLAGCGGGASSPDAWEEVANDAVVEPAANDGPSAPAGCPFALSDVRAAAVGIRYVVEGLSSASVLVTPLAAGSQESVDYAYEVRDERGREAGTTSYRCDADGLALVASGTDAHHLAFAPPLPALSPTPTEGVLTGVATLTTPAGVSALPYAFEFAVVDDPAAGPMQSEPGERMRVSSVLVLGGEDAETRVESESVWLISPTVLGILQRTQTTTHADGVAEERVERAGSLRR